MNKKFYLMFLTSILCLIFLSSCYHLVGSGSSEASKEIENLAITFFKNKTDVPEIEIIITDAMVKEFTAFSPKIITDVEHAKAILEGNVLSYNLETVAADERDKVLEYRLIIKLEIKLVNVEESNILYQNKDFEGFIDFKVPKDSISRKREEDYACKRLAQKLSKKLVGEIFEGF